jgi:uncharacterized protein (TIGR03083 family)
MTGWLPAITVLAAYHDGVTAICQLASQFSGELWQAPTPCADWRAADLAGHLRCVADDYREYLDDAPDSRLARLMASGAGPYSLARKLARQNAAELAALPDAPPGDHIAAFARSARSYACRLERVWELPHHRYLDHEVTVAGMAGAACVEWHLHAWDLARALGSDYRPADAELIAVAWRAGVPQRCGGPPPAEGDPWRGVLAASGRSADWLA